MAELLPPPSMVALRGDLASPALRAAVESLGLAVPEPLRIEGTSASGAAWMSPDELLLFVPDALAAVASLSGALAGEHHLALDVSDLRALIGLRDGARETLAKLCPADLHPDAFGPGAFRRSHLGQVAAAFWLEREGARVLCFRSVAGYALRLLSRSEADGPVGHFA